MNEFQNIKSEFIKEKIKGSSWKHDREYIKDLIFLEKGISGIPLGWTGSMRYLGLRNKYPK